jgi:Mrp family chromosome partitioning ATPase
MPSGQVPPNPSELLHNVKMMDLMKWLRHNYDVIIFDTPPIGLVADALELLKYSDVNLLIVRQFKTYKKSLSAS